MPDSLEPDSLDSLIFQHPHSLKKSMSSLSVPFSISALLHSCIPAASLNLLKMLLGKTL
jgi:hypothetical protein